MKYTAIVNGKTYEVEIERASSARRSATRTASTTAQNSAQVPVSAPQKEPQIAAKKAPESAPLATTGRAVVSPMPGNVLDVMVKVGDQVEAGQIVVVLEAMKMEIEITAEAAGIVSSIEVKKGDPVESGSTLMLL